MTYSDWQEELSEGVKTKLIIKALKGARKLSKKLGRKVKGSVENIGATKAGGRLKMNDVVNRPVKPNKPTLKKGESWTGGGTRDGKAIPTRNLSARYKTYIKKKQKYDKDIKDFNDNLIKDRKDAVDTSNIGDNPSARAKIRDILNKINKKKDIGESAIAIKAGSKLIPALMTGIGAAGTIMQAKRKYRTRLNPGVRNNKRVMSDAEKKIFDKSQRDSDQKVNTDVTPREKVKQKILDRRKKDRQERNKKPNRIQSDRRRLLRGMAKGEVMLDQFTPTNNVGGGQIAGTVEAGDNPPVKKKKRYIYGGTGSRKMWMNNK